MAGPVSSAPYDDPVARTRLSWSRSLLLVIGVALLISRGALLAGEPWWIAAIAAVTLGLVVAGLARMRLLAKRGRGAPDLHRSALVVGTVAIGALAVIAVLTSLL